MVVGVVVVVGVVIVRLIHNGIRYSPVATLYCCEKMGQRFNTLIRIETEFESL